MANAEAVKRFALTDKADAKGRAAKTKGQHAAAAKAFGAALAHHASAKTGMTREIGRLTAARNSHLAAAKAPMRQRGATRTKGARGGASAGGTSGS